MPLSVAKIQAEIEQVYCPFTGQPVHGDSDVNQIPSLLFVYIGDAGGYSYVSEQFKDLIREANLECDEEPVDDPDVLSAKLDLKDGFLLEVDTNWNGVNTYGFVSPR